MALQDFQSNKLLVFDVWGDFAHFKQIYATTSAISYPIPFKTAIYGMVGAILGFDKDPGENHYLSHFREGNCRIALQTMSPFKTQRIPMNLSPEPGPIKNNRKPTLMEFIHSPKYRIYFQHKNEALMEKLKGQLINKISHYTLSLGLANLLANFEWKAECTFHTLKQINKPISSIIPKSKFIRFDTLSDNAVTEIGMYAVEMDEQRNVTQRDDVLVDRKGVPIPAFVEECQAIDGLESNPVYIVLF